MLFNLLNVTKKAYLKYLLVQFFQCINVLLVSMICVSNKIKEL